MKTTVDDGVMRVHSYTDGSEHTLKTVKNHTKSNEDAATTQFQFDGIGQLLKVTDPAGKFTTYTYDMAGRKLSVTHPSTGTTSFTYDNLGNVLTKKTGKGDVVTYTYGDENPMQLASVETKQYNVDGSVDEDKVDDELTKTQRT